MRCPTALAAMAACLLAIGSSSAVAHHSVSHDFDVFRKLTLQGTVTQVNWGNPHIGLELAVRDAQGRLQSWRIEGGPPNALLRRGWSRNSLAVGAVVSIEAWPARDGSRRANAHFIRLPDGRKLDAASSYHPPRD